ncbi:FliH/SctL family protein [Anaeromyxobacter diazotrophicus]|uniref:Flagellar assembly protein FliH n=1 Tax=Anaeromyxobacter diazotrophicus TaxID=2590199 RepID=A0A7I9VLK9_9BACT|nr:FliH/SctL family protein [Anaeromyxobacter diazotrophicus]GEJ57281.1 hypothetical protein AMYX_20220 [Anaeromyxobacter diazotrophicus]
MVEQEAARGERRPPGSRRIPAQLWDAAAEARRLREEAAAEAGRLLQAAREETERLRAAAAEAGREEGLARATELVARAALARERLLAGARAELADLALELARRIVTRAAALDPEVVIELAGRALEVARGHSALTVRAHPEDLAALRAAEPRLAGGAGGGRALAWAADPALARGEVRVETEAGAVDARLAPQLEALGRALRAEEDGW